MNTASTSESTWDVVIIGGSLSGASVATLLRREHPHLRVLILEKSERFGRRVGEATVEVSAFFLGRILGLTRHMNECHLVKQGMRFWFHNEKTATLDQSSEIGGRFNVRLPSYQLDRSVFDAELLARACEAGAVLRRPAQVHEVRLTPGGQQAITFTHGDARETAHCRWVIDASGVAAVLARQEGWWRPNDAHPTTAVWSRWKGVKDFDGLELAAKYPEWAAKCYGVRGTATNHVVGDGWWSWWIPLKGGDVSVGIVMDQRLVSFPRDGGKLGDRMKQFLVQHPVGRELLEGATYIEEDVHWRKNLAYYADRVIGDGFALVGDASAFMDPLYSPGMDWIAYTATAAITAVGMQQRGEDLKEFVGQINHDYCRSYERWFTAIYKDKYEYIGEFDLMRLAFNLDLGLYYLGVVSQPFRRGMPGLLEPPFSTAPSTPVYYLARLYNRRFAQIARRRRRRGQLGRSNMGESNFISGYTFSLSNLRSIFGQLLRWGFLELRELFSVAASVPQPEGASTPQPVREPL